MSVKFGIFSLSQIPDQSRRAEAIQEELEEFVLAEQLGYDTAWVAEHLFSTYGVVASTQVIAAAIAALTSRIRIGTAVSIIPFNHPLRTASDFGLIDIQSNGRLNFGVGRAYQPHEFTGLGLEMAESRQMFDEGMEMILAAWTQEKVDHHGKYWSTSGPVEVLPKPAQKPHPPVYMATISPASFQTAADKGWGLQLAAPFTYRTYREEWMDKLAEHLADYEAACVAKGRDPKAAERAILVPFFCAETEDLAVERYARHVEWFYSKVSGHERPVGAAADKLVPGYELQFTEGKKTKEAGLLAFEHLHRHSAAIASDPAGCISKLQFMREKFGITEFILWFNIGGIDTELARESMRLTMDKVIPHISA
ncbi:LLM class flavin-dependent oxidoreductase [Sporichthya sp.]|uniref:LLM class flavin-dependent oxidoreductase n=1 Tax=Sporichthya sp. TaxID=65475 RepID=UPI00185DA9F0|nr:LLM class flavin-dependent oxidoreductase [Sporichthya sp.]MBA3741384.1 LLM class flavin-dependent oxidoreductase [Sporichthya sp.]